MIIKEMLTKAIDVLGEDRLLDAEVLLAHLFNEEKTYLMVNRDDEVSVEVEELFDAYVKKLENGEPLAYLTMEKEFYGLSFYVDKRVLVPRPETEQIVDRAVTFLRARSPFKRQMKFLDVGTGSGNIPIAILSTVEDLEDVEIRVFADAVDVSNDALDVARINTEQHGLEDRLELFQSDLLENVSRGEHYDLIVANLPYIGEEKNRFVEKNVEKYEPNVALFGGKTGLELYEDMFNQLSEKGVTFDLMIGEFGFAQKDLMGEILEGYFPGKWKIVEDLAGIERIFLVGGGEEG